MTNSEVHREAKKRVKLLRRAFHNSGSIECADFEPDFQWVFLHHDPEVLRQICIEWDRDYTKHFTGNNIYNDLKRYLPPASYQRVIALIMRGDTRFRPYEKTKGKEDEQDFVGILPVKKADVATQGTVSKYWIKTPQRMTTLDRVSNWDLFVMRDPTLELTQSAWKLKNVLTVKPDGDGNYKIKWFWPGTHRLILIYYPYGRDDGRKFGYEHIQVVVKKDYKIVDKLLSSTQFSQKPKSQLDGMKNYLKALLKAERRQGSKRLDPTLKTSLESQVKGLEEKLRETDDETNISLKAVHYEINSGKANALNIHIGRQPGTSKNNTWKVVDITNPANKKLCGVYPASGKTPHDAISKALAAWYSDNRYPPGFIKCEVHAHKSYMPTGFYYTFQTDGMSWWDEIQEFFSQVGLVAGITAMGAGIVTALLPIPGSRAVSAFIWASMICGTTSAAVGLYQRRREGLEWGAEDALDILTIAGNICSGGWMATSVKIKGGLLVEKKLVRKFASGFIIGELTTDGAQGIIIAIKLSGQLDNINTIQDPKKRLDAMIHFLVAAGSQGLMMYLAFRSSKSDLEILRNEAPIMRLKPKAGENDLPGKVDKTPFGKKEIDLDVMRKAKRYGGLSGDDLKKTSYIETEKFIESFIKKNPGKAKLIADGNDNEILEFIKGSAKNKHGWGDLSKIFEGEGDVALKIRTGANKTLVSDMSTSLVNYRDKLVESIENKFKGRRTGSTGTMKNDVDMDFDSYADANEATKFMNRLCGKVKIKKRLGSQMVPIDFEEAFDMSFYAKSELSHLYDYFGDTKMRAKIILDSTDDFIEIIEHYRLNTGKPRIPRPDDRLRLQKKVDTLVESFNLNHDQATAGEITKLQMQLKLYDRESYISPGGIKIFVTGTKKIAKIESSPNLSPLEMTKKTMLDLKITDQELFQAAIEQRLMIIHQFHKMKKDIGLAVMSYKTHKYADRIFELARLAGIDNNRLPRSLKTDFEFIEMLSLAGYQRHTVKRSLGGASALKEGRRLTTLFKKMEECQNFIIEELGKRIGRTFAKTPACNWNTAQYRNIAHSNRKQEPKHPQEAFSKHVKKK